MKPWRLPSGLQRGIPFIIQDDCSSASSAAIANTTRSMLKRFEEPEMELKPIRTQKDYQAALAEAERLWDAPAKSPEADRLGVLVMLIEDYERQHYPIPDPDPVDFLIHVMENRGLTLMALG
ncbi:MAG: hypothetical protein HY936_03855 [Nitrosomonadales bacterium]|nr:hypothetical protein [Nitrosomonadales bacterium]